ncbi:hypothetical protein N9J72_01790 [Candidatus Gracilibacteria bacterium]|nr:hypothetical protein [Candidatus Gracilibacteria bacterium]
MSEIQGLHIENVSLSHDSFSKNKNPEVSLASIGVLEPVKKRVTELFLDEDFTAEGAIAEIKRFLKHNTSSIIDSTINYEKELWEAWYKPDDDMNSYHYKNQVPFLYHLCSNHTELAKQNFDNLTLPQSLVTALHKHILEGLTKDSEEKIGYLKTLEKYHQKLPVGIRGILEQGHKYCENIGESEFEEMYFWVNGLIQNDEATIELDDIDAIYFILAAGRNTQTILQRLLTFNSIIKEIEKLRENYNEYSEEVINLFVSYLKNSVISYQYWNNLFAQSDVPQHIQTIQDAKEQQRKQEKLQLNSLKDKGENKKIFADITAIFRYAKEVIDSIDDNWTFQNEFSVHWSNETYSLLNFDSENI